MNPILMVVHGIVAESQDFWELIGEALLTNTIFSNCYQAYYLSNKSYVLLFAWLYSWEDP